METSVFENFSWFELWSPLLLLAIIGLSILYLKYMVKSKKYQNMSKRVQYFFIAMFLLYAVIGTPYHIVARNYLFSAHIFQLSILFFVVAPLIILSFPPEYLRGLFWNYRMKSTMTAFSHPWLNVLLFNGLLTLYLIPGIFNFLKEYAFLGIIAQIILFILAFFMWWIIISPLPKMDHLSHLTKIVYLFFASTLLMPIGFYLLVIQAGHYPAYGAVAGEFFKPFTLIYDQQLAGGLLKITQITSYAYAMFYIFIKWGKNEEDKEGQVDDENIRVVRGVVIHHKKKD